MGAPKIDHTAATAEGYVSGDSTDVATAAALREARASESGWKRHKDALTAAVKARLGGAKGIVVDGVLILDVSPRAGRAKVDLDVLRIKYPDVYAEVVTFGDPSEVINIK